MKDLYGIREQDINKLNNLGLIPDGTVIQEDGKNSRREKVYCIFFDTSKEKKLAYNAIYGDTWEKGTPYPDDF